MVKCFGVKMAVIIGGMLILGIVATAEAQETARTLAMGHAVVAVSDDYSVVNPAGLAALKFGGPGALKDSEGAVGFSSDSEIDAFHFNYVKALAQGDSGLGLSHLRIDADSTSRATLAWIGYGARFTEDSPLSWGLAVMRYGRKIPRASDYTYPVDIGFLHRLWIPGTQQEVKLGIHILNVNEPKLFNVKLPRTLDIGAATQLTPEVLVAFDVQDVTAEQDRLARAGIEVEVGAAGAIRIGLYKDEFAWGLGWNFQQVRVDFGRNEENDLNLISLVASF